VVKQITSPDGEVIEQGTTTVLSRPISEKTSETMRSLLTYVVEKGGGKNARIEGYTVGGKTAPRRCTSTGRCPTTYTIGSFIGIAPMEDPAIAVIVIVDKAAVAVDYGFRDRSALRKTDPGANPWFYLGYPKMRGPRLPRKSKGARREGMAVSDAVDAVKDAGLDCVLDGSGAYVVDQLPARAPEMTEGSLVMLYVEGATDERNT
jgi:hypothetical protein